MRKYVQSLPGCKIKRIQVFSPRPAPAPAPVQPPPIIIINPPPVQAVQLQVFHEEHVEVPHPILNDEPEEPESPLSPVMHLPQEPSQIQSALLDSIMENLNQPDSPVVRSPANSPTMLHSFNAAQLVDVDLSPVRASTPTPPPTPSDAELAGYDTGTDGDAPVIINTPTRPLTSPMAQGSPGYVGSVMAYFGGGTVSPNKT